jgi:hypothetical protein
LGIEMGRPDKTPFFLHLGEITIYTRCTQVENKTNKNASKEFRIFALAVQLFRLPHVRLRP